MRISLIASLLGLSLLLGACDRRPSQPPTPVVLAPAAPVAVPLSVEDPSVPKATQVMTAASDVPRQDIAGRSTAAMTPAQESTAMPMPGQNNDHSVPVVPARAASAP